MASRKKPRAELSRDDSAAFETLRGQILGGDPLDLCKSLLAIADEERRKAMAGPVYDLYRQIWAGKVKVKGNSHYINSEFAVAALADLADARKVRVTCYWGKPGIEQAYIELLRRRPLAWRTSWMRAQLQSRESVLSWGIITALLESGVALDLESDELVRHFGNRFNDVRSSLSAKLRERPYLLALVPRLFELPNGALTTTFGKHRERWPHFETWGEALVTLCQSGELDRTELLGISAEALTRDFPALQLAAIADFHANLKPSAAEKAELLDRYLELMGSPNPKVAGAAAKWCLSVKDLDACAFLRAAEPVMALPTKTVAMTVLKAARTMSDKDSSLLLPARDLAQSALTHPNREVVEEARGWLALMGEDGVEPVAEQQVPPEDPVQLDLEGIEPRFITLFQLHPDNGVPAEIVYRMGEVPFRLTPIVPIADLTELIDTVASAVEECRSGDELERILDGLSRFGGHRPADFSIRTEALRKRVQTMVDSESVKGLVSGWGGVSREVKALLLSWLEGRQVLIPLHDFAKSSSLYPFTAGRLRELSSRVVAGDCGPLLSAPTALGGWIEPTVLVTRIRQCSRLDNRRHDLVAALIRLSPHGKGQALQQASGLDHEEGRALRWALGGSEAPRRGDRRSELWLAAARVRRPRGDLSAELGFEETDRSLTFSVVSKGKPPQWNGAPLPTSSPTKSLISTVKGLFSRVRPPAELDPTSCCYGVMRQAWNEPDSHGVWSLHWRALVWPENLDSYWRLGTLCLGERWDQDGSGMAPNQTFLEPLFDPDRPWDEPARVVIWMALLSKAGEIRGAAVDLLIEGVSDGRGHPTPLADTLCQLRETGIKANRLADALGQVAAAGELHRWTVAQILSQFLQGPLPHAGHHLLELLTDVADSLDAGLREALSRAKLSGKSARHVSRLLELPDSVERPRIASLMRVARLERARAWSLTPLSEAWP